MIEERKNTTGRIAFGDRVLSPSATEPKVSAHSGNAPLRGHRSYLDVGNPIEWREHKPPTMRGHRKWLEVRR